MFTRVDWHGYRFDGHTSAVEDATAWAVRFRVEVDEEWCTRAAHIRVWSDHGERALRAESDGAGHWRIDGVAVEELDGCLDIDLEASACTNTLPIHRLGLGVGQTADAPAVYVRAVDLAVERLEQRYTRVDSDDSPYRFHYVAPRFEYDDVLSFDAAALTLEYPALASRVVLSVTSSSRALASRAGRRCRTRDRRRRCRRVRRRRPPGTTVGFRAEWLFLARTRPVVGRRGSRDTPIGPW